MVDHILYSLQALNLRSACSHMKAYETCVYLLLTGPPFPTLWLYTITAVFVRPKPLSHPSQVTGTAMETGHHPATWHRLFEKSQNGLVML